MNLSYPAICAMMARLRVEMSWADEQYPVTLFQLMGEYAKLGKKPEKKKVGASEIGNYIRG